VPTIRSSNGRGRSLPSSSVRIGTTSVVQCAPGLVRSSLPSNFESRVGRVAVCAEAIAVGMAGAAGDTDISVTVNRGGEVVAPCGICRELISDYAPDAAVIVPGAEGPERVSIRTLLPNKYARTTP